MHMRLRTNSINDEGSKAWVPVFYKDCGTLAFEEPFYKQKWQQTAERIAKHNI